MSAKRARQNRARARAVKAAFGDRPRCAACGPLRLIGVDSTRTGCRGLADDAHELRSRARGGSITAPDNIIPVSRACHTYITTHPADAADAGLALPSTDHLSSSLVWDRSDDSPDNLAAEP